MIHSRRVQGWIRRIAFSTAVVFGVILTGCQEEDLVEGAILSASEIVGRVDGPYRFRQAVSSTEVMISISNAPAKRVYLRGVRSSRDKSRDEVSRSELHSWLRIEDVYLLSDTIVTTTNGVKGVLLLPTTQRGGVNLNTGEIKRYPVNFAVVQMWQLQLGEVVADHSDTNHWLYKNFKRAETEAKRNKTGCWSRESVERAKP